MVLNRARFLRDAALALTAPAFVRPFAAQAAGNGTILVAILQAGGCDGLNTVIPLGQYGTYTDLRTVKGATDPANALALGRAALQTTAFDANPATPSAAATQYAFHPSMASMRSLYATGHLAVLAGVGVIPDEVNRLSHEVGQYDWASGKINAIGTSTVGWLGQTLDADAGGRLPAMVSITGEQPLLMNGNVQGALALGAPLETFRTSTGAVSDTDDAARTAGFAAIQTQQQREATTEYVRSLSTSASSFVSTIQDVAKQTASLDYSPPVSYLDLQLAQIARLIVSGAGVRGYYAVQGGYDTHAAQNQDHPTLVRQFADGIATFYAFLRAKGKSSNVVIMSYSDFGRRPEMNDTYGTDHGTTAINFVAGDPVRGGVYGTYPSLSALDADGNLVVNVDFRNQISDVVTFLGGDPTPIVGKTYGKLGFL